MNNANGPHKVLRPFDADGTRLVPGTIVDVTDWRNGWQLVDRGYLVAAPETAASKPVKKTATKKPAAKKASTRVESTPSGKIVHVDKTPPIED